MIPEKLKQKIDAEVAKMKFNAWLPPHEVEWQKTMARQHLTKGAELAMEEFDWIDCDDRLPEAGVWILVTGRSGFVDTGERIDDIEGRPAYNNPNWCGPSTAITHWMPLPKSPAK